MGNKKLADDVLILKAFGVPLFAKCFGGQTCKNHPDHALFTFLLEIPLFPSAVKDKREILYWK
ncbi:MAG: hypothetical protein KAJ76_05670 [Candidatus Heimdallarchaeota archaeon]|nr:hypothetical protein [Candidatus Heimdallarchaeota archaeon]MCK5298373.1 hypothetical protein [Candidatus Heimdallarchaeota archaeon]